MNTANLQYQQKTERLADAFRIFNELSENLAHSYQSLQLQVANLNRELASVRSERVNTLIEKEKLASRLQEILAALPAAVLILNACGQIVDCNEHANDFLGEALIGRQWQNVVDSSLQPIFDSPHQRQLKDGRTVNITRNRLSNDAEQIILLADVSELRNLQETLAQQKHLTAMGEMVASLAHQVRTPLATAILYASQMTRPTLMEEKRQQFSEKILERLHHLERQVNDMLIFAKQGRLTMQGFSWQCLLNHLAEAMEGYTGTFSVKNRLTEDRLLGNEDALRGALLNLLNNAAEAGATIIDMSAMEVDGYIEITIRDNGPGIDTERVTQVFEPFYTTKINGTGLGLAVVESVVKAHSGSVDCQSVRGQGTQFTLRLPCLNQYRLGLSDSYTANATLENHYETI